jgi:hypothetical protein
MPNVFPGPGESREDAEKRVSREAADAAPAWMGKPAAVIEIKGASGHLVNLARGKDADGKTVWRESEAMRPHQARKNAPELTPENVLELLREMIGG